MKAQIAVVTRDDLAALITYLAARVVRTSNGGAFSAVVFQCLVIEQRFCRAPMLFARAVVKLHIPEPRRRTLLCKCQRAFEEAAHLIADQVPAAAQLVTVIHDFALASLPQQHQQYWRCTAAMRAQQGDVRGAIAQAHAFCFPQSLSSLI